MKAKIMIVDDENDFEQLVRQKFRRQIREQEYEFVFANNGKDALDKLDEHPDVEIVFSDINMPIMDGLTLLAKLNEKNPLLKAGSCRLMAIWTISVWRWIVAHLTLFVNPFSSVIWS